jgi:KDO2-lipid IV(A) lauroyltransferase
VKFRRKIREPFFWLAAKLLMAALWLLPHRSLRGLSAVFGRAWWLDSKTRRVTLANVAVAFPEKSAAERTAIARASCRNIALTFLEFLWFARHPQRLRAKVDMAGPEAQAILAEAGSDRGGVFLSPHLGNWELSAQIVAASGVPMTAVAAKVKSPLMARIVTRAREFHGIRIIPEHGAARGMLQSVREGRPVGLLIDQNTRLKEGGVFIPFFGLPATASRAPAAFARRMKLGVTVAALVRMDGRLTLRRETLPKPVADYTDDLELTRDLLALHERLIRRFPEQYLWMYERWRYIPAANAHSLMFKNCAIFCSDNRLEPR